MNNIVRTRIINANSKKTKGFYNQPLMFLMKTRVVTFEKCLMKKICKSCRVKNLRDVCAFHAISDQSQGQLWLYWQAKK